MLNAPNGYVWQCPRAVAPHGMPDGYELWRDEDGYYWWHHGASNRESELFVDRWQCRREAVADQKRVTK